MMLSDVLSRTSGQRVACATGQDGAYWLIGLGRPGSRLPLRTSVAGLGGAYRGGRPPTACFRRNSVHTPAVRSQNCAICMPVAFICRTLCTN